MFIIFESESRIILSYGQGTPIESENKLYLGSNIICNDLTFCGWKYIADQILEREYDADYYTEITPEPSYQDQIDAILELL